MKHYFVLNRCFNSCLRRLYHEITSGRRIKVVEVGPRDGLQNIKQFLPTEKKVELINRLSGTGLTAIESTSFVNKDIIPQLSDAEQVMKSIMRNSNVQYSVLVPTLNYFKMALKSNISEIAFVTTASDTYNKKNTNRSTRESVIVLEEIMKLANLQNVKVRGYIGCVIACPYEGAVKPSTVANIAKSLSDLGCYEISLGDTTGVGTPGSISSMLNTVLKEIPAEKLAVHLHDTYGQALVNTLASLELGINTVDSSISGLGGCPFAPGAAGNVATEQLIYMLHGLGYHTGVNLNKLMDVSEWISSILNLPKKPRMNLEKYS